METRYFYILRHVLVASDLLLVNFCFLVALQLSAKYEITLDVYNHLLELVILNLIWIISTVTSKLYNESTIHNVQNIYKATGIGVLLHSLFFAAFSFLVVPDFFQIQLLIIFYLVFIFGLFISRVFGTSLIYSISENYGVRKAVAILGMNDGGLKLSSYLLKQSSLNFVGFLDQNYASGNGEISANASSTNDRLKAAADSGIEEVFVTVDAGKMNDLAGLIKEGEKNCIRLKFVSDVSELETDFNFDKMGEFSVLSSRKEPLEKIKHRFQKRAFDVIVSLIAIIFVLSWLYPLLALIIKLQSPGPIFFKQLRTGRNNVPFWCYKFRSMKVEDEKKQTDTTSRSTRIGRFMRKTSIDELPQFFNVLIGQMSIIGPRPHMLSHTDEYSKLIDKYMVRQFLKPGISGWAQVNGFRGEIKETHLLEKRVAHDIWYMENWAVLLDVKIMFLTIFNVLKGEVNAY